MKFGRAPTTNRMWARRVLTGRPSVTHRNQARKRPNRNRPAVGGRAIRLSSDALLRQPTLRDVIARAAASARRSGKVVAHLVPVSEPRGSVECPPRDLHHV